MSVTLSGHFNPYHSKDFPFSCVWVSLVKKWLRWCQVISCFVLRQYSWNKQSVIMYMLGILRTDTDYLFHITVLIIEILLYLLSFVNSSCINSNSILYLRKVLACSSFLSLLSSFGNFMFETFLPRFNPKHIYHCSLLT